MNVNPPAGAGATVAYTLSELWNNLMRRYPDTNAANRQQLLALGDVFELNNVAPRTYSFDAGLFVNGTKVTQWSLGADSPIPEFRFFIPQGMPNQPVASELLTSFTITIYNADYSAVVFRSTITGRIVKQANNLATWTPLQAEWDTIKNAAGAGRHWTISGGLTTATLPRGTYTTGMYWSGVNDFDIVP
jgi:hypothetical protein